MASVSIGGVSQKSLINHSLNGILVSPLATFAVLTTRTADHHLSLRMSIINGESSTSVLDAIRVPATVAVSDVHRAGTRVHIPAHSGSEAHNG
ncbi:hypothetical protein Tco_0710566 [Tanacetum coccineum]